MAVAAKADAFLHQKEGIGFIELGAHMSDRPR